jgi:hypothetical protein
MIDTRGIVIQKDRIVQHSPMHEISRNEELGQVYTPANIAAMMSLLLARHKNVECILDPCIGGNVFFESIEKLFPRRDFFLQGIEVDPVGSYPFFKKARRNLWIGNFFDLPTRQLYDGIIMNPPYVRQEILSYSKINSKEKIIASVGETFSSRANLYVYFFAKAAKHLRPGGKLVVICYDSWLFTGYGKEFKKFLQENFSLDVMVHIRNSAFENALVGATILELTKGGSRQQPIRVCVGDKNEIPSMQTVAELDSFLKKNDWFEAEKKNQGVNQGGDYTTIDARFRTNRGLETPANKYFYAGLSDLPNSFMRPVIKDPKIIDGYTISRGDLGSVLMVPPGQRTLDATTKRYLKMVESQSDGYETLSRLITTKPESWFALPEPPKGNIVFNYYLRDRVDFIYNPQRHMASNNFYVMESKDPYLDLITLNSSLVRNTILATARNQGDGLKKVQLYEFRDLSLPNTDLLTEKQRNELRDLGKQLAKQPRENPDPKVIGSADRILEKKFSEPIPQTYQNAIYALV